MAFGWLIGAALNSLGHSLIELSCGVHVCTVYNILFMLLWEIKTHSWKTLFSTFYRVPHLKPYNSRRLFFHLTNKFSMFQIHFYILQIWPFYNISSFFDLCKTLFHKSVFFKKNFFFGKNWFVKNYLA